MDCEKCGTRMAKHSRRGDAQQYRCRECNHFQTAPAALGHEDVPARASPETAGLHDDGNRATCVGPVGDSPPTLDSLLDSFQVDVDVWAVERWVVNRWDVTAKVAGRLVKSPNYQAKAWLTRKIPVKCEWPAIQGAFVAAPPKMPAVILDGGLRRAVILADAQAGFRRDTNTGELEPTHDPAACSVALEIIRDIEPDLLVYLGDMIDLPELGKYRITPDLIMTTQPSIDWLGGWLAETARHAGRRVYLEGNHEIRLRNALVDNLRAAYGIRPANEPDTPPAISIPYLLGLDDLGIEWIDGYPRGRFWINKNLMCTHGNRALRKSGHTAATMLEAGLECSVVFGHGHRGEMAHITRLTAAGERTYGAYCVPTLARIDGAVPSAAAHENWQQGLGIAEFNDRLFHVELPLIFGGECVLGGKLYTASAGVTA